MCGSIYYGDLFMKVCIIGDVITDRYIYGSSERLSPEAPVPIIKQEYMIYPLLLFT
jgi:bifunctional ADP-heptose synthase (sugar kinase/adenylyltransferase)